ncbi:MAG: glycine dehydrogenase, partial [Solirubrobacterales bacterium]
MEFIPHTAEQRREMLATIGLSMDDLFGDVPPELMAGPLKLPHGLSEQEVRDRLADLAGKNSIDLTLFLGGGFYDHFIPSAVYSIIGRSEFYTAYTPYQPEIS